MERSRSRSGGGSLGCSSRLGCFLVCRDQHNTLHDATVKPNIHRFAHLLHTRKVEAQSGTAKKLFSAYLCLQPKRIKVDVMRPHPLHSRPPQTFLLFFSRPPQHFYRYTKVYIFISGTYILTIRVIFKSIHASMLLNCRQLDCIDGAAYKLIY